MSEAYKQLEQLADELGLTLEWQFVPQRFDDGTKLYDMCMKWTFGLKKNGRGVLVSPYTQGVAYCPSYKRIRGAGVAVADYDAVRNECELGTKTKEPKEPLTALWSIARDCQGVMDSKSFEEWATEFGYDTDSRKAEAIYNECVKHYLSLKYFIGDEGIDRLAAVEL